MINCKQDETNLFVQMSKIDWLTIFVVMVLLSGYLSLGYYKLVDQPVLFIITTCQIWHLVQWQTRISWEWPELLMKSIEDCPWGIKILSILRINKRTWRQSVKCLVNFDGVNSVGTGVESVTAIWLYHTIFNLFQIGWNKKSGENIASV